MNRVAAALLCLAAAAAAQDVRLKVEKGLAVPDFLRQIHVVTGQLVLWAPEDLKDKQVGGTIDMTVPRKNVYDALLFVLSTCDVEVRRYGTTDPVMVAIPSRAVMTRFRATGLDLEIEFDRGPATWKNAGAVAGSLAADSVKALIGKLPEGATGERRAAARLLGLAGPRSPEVVDALAAVVGDSRVRRAACQALERHGHAAKRALPTLAKAPQSEELASAVRAIRDALHPGLLDPALAKTPAPREFDVRFETTRGVFVMKVTRAWSPKGVDRFYNLARIGYFDGNAFFRVMKGFVAQFGKHGDPRVNRVWYTANIKDEPVQQSNKRGYVTFAKTNDPDTRSTQIFINLGDNTNLDAMGFAPFAVVTEGMDVVDQLFSGYGDGKVDQGRIHFDGNEYLKRNFPKLDYIKTARIVP